MDAPHEVKAAIFLAWVVVVIETIDRLWRISKDSYATTFTRLGSNLTIATLSSAALVAFFIFFAAQRHNWARIALLVSTLAGWCLWCVWLFGFRASSEYAWSQWLGYGSLTAMELIVLILLFHGRGALWYRSRPAVSDGAL
jgi:hypothetical protein